MKCQNCGRELKNGARFCIHCGAQHDEYGQLIGGGSSGSVNYDQTMMASNQGGDYDKTMMFGSTGFNQYSSNDMSQGYGQDNYGYEESGYYETKTKAKKKISPIIIICPILIVLILGFSVFGGKLTKKGGKKVSKTTELTAETSPTPAPVATVSDGINIVEETTPEAETPPIDGYWDYEGVHFYIKGEMQKNMWVGDAYVDKDGNKVVSDWVDEKYYVDAAGKKARNQWIEFTYINEETGMRDRGYYYVGKDGLKVKNKEVDGRYLNENGVWMPNFSQQAPTKSSSETKETTTKETTTKESSNKNNTDTSKKDREKTEETSETIKEAKAAETTAASVVYSTTQATQTSQQIYAQTTAASIVMETSPVASPVINPNATAPQNSSVIYATTEPSTSGSGASTTTTGGGSDGVVYQLASHTFPDNNITRYDQIVITDTKYPNLMASVAEWTNNRGMTTGYGDKVTQELKVERNDKKIFSVSEVISKYEDNKIYEKDKNGWTWDATSGQVLTLEDIFVNEEKYEECAEKVLKKLKANKSSIDEDTYEEISEIEALDVYEYCTWYLGSAGLTFVFNRDTIGAKKLDGLSYTLSYTSSSDNLNKMLKSEYRKK